jgi:hypothetical protein
MIASELASQKQRLDVLFDKAREIHDVEVQSHWCRYLCVLVSGYLENSVRSAYSEFARCRAQPPVASYVARQLGRFQNPSMEKILTVAGGFSTELQTRLQVATSGRLAESVNSIVGNRNNIAHGKSVSLTLHTLTQYYQGAFKVVQLIHDLCDE